MKSILPFLYLIALIVVVVMDLLKPSPSPAFEFFPSNEEILTLVGAVGVLFTVAGQNDIADSYPNISLYYYWNKDGKGVMR